ncbi:MAG: gliding motility-associated C-terminal domain-containing protein [Taibaiella sp.]|nr:gliding motility-associated C-terminal domain-containing protein [Taibaiella sp.]
MGYPVYVWDDGSSTPERTIYGSGTYWVRYGSVCIQTVDTYYIDMPDSNISVHNNDTVVCIGSVVDLIADDVEGYVYEWMPSEGIADPASPVTTIEATESRTVTLKVNYPGCDPFYRSFYMEVKEVPVVEMPASTTICLGKGHEVHPYIPGADEDYSYSWVPAAGVSDPSSKDVILSPELTTTYYLTVNSGAEDCDVVDSIRISVIPNSIDLVNNDTSLCSGISIPVSVEGHPLFTYYWAPEEGIADPHQANSSITPEASGWVTITASREGCDDMTDSFYIDLQPVPEVNAGPDDTLCGGVPYQLFAGVIPDDYEFYTYEWTPSTFLSDGGVKNPWFTSYTASEDLILEVRTPIGCSSRDTVLLTVVPKRSVLLNVTDTGYCPPGMVQLEASNADSYVWIPGTGLSDDSISNPVANPDESVEYMVIGYTEGCMDTQYVQISVYPQASLYVPDSVTIYAGEVYEVDLASNASYYSWYPPEGLSDVNIANPLAGPYVRTRYFVTATTEHGCTLTDSIDIVVDNGYVFEVPNAFVPGNGFSDNGTFRILKRGEARLDRFEVYDRWGVKVFETSDIEEGWDGRYDGKTQPMGVYVYIIEGSLPTGDKVHLQGNVTLIR